MPPIRKIRVRATGGHIFLKQCHFCETGRSMTILLDNNICTTCLNKLRQEDRLLNTLKILIKEL